MSKPIVLTELDDEIILSERDFAHFSQRGLIHTRAKKSVFNQAGVFAGEKNIFVIVPWVTKGLSGDDRQALCGPDDACSRVLDVLFHLRDLSTECSKLTAPAMNGRDFLYLAFLKSLRRLIDEGLRNNVFRADQDVLPMIRGKWLAARDLAKAEMPISFSCEFSVCDRNHPILSIAREYCYQLMKAAQSRRLRNEASTEQARLADSADLPIDIRSTYRAALHLSGTDRRFAGWSSWLKSLESVVDIDSNGRLALVSSGLVSDAEFPTARFFELAVTRIITRSGYQVGEQKSEQILGGSYWYKGGSTSEEQDFDANALPADTSHSRYSSRPDAIISRADLPLPILVECKYKHLKVETTKSGANKVRGFDRGDRNQLLSFLLSYSESLKFDTSKIILLYPRTHGSLSLTAKLVFPSWLVTGQGEFGVHWKRGKSFNDQSVAIKFVGIDVIATLKEISSMTKEKTEVRALLSHFYDPQKMRPVA